MFQFPSPITLRLARGELLSWRQGRVRLRVLSGAAWVTRPDDGDDHFLQIGDVLDLSDGLIGAEQDLCVSFEAPQRGGDGLRRGAAAAVKRIVTGLSLGLHGRGAALRD